MPRGKTKISSPSYRYVGFLLPHSRGDWDHFIGWFEGALKKDIKVTYLPPDGAHGDLQAINDAITDLMKYCNVIVTATTAAALALKTATQGTNVQFVYASIGDAQASHLVPTSGGNFTGGSNGQAEATTVVRRRVKHMINKPKLFNPKFAVAGDYSDAAHQAAMDAVYGEMVTQGASVPLQASDQACLLNSSVANFDNFMTNLSNNGIKSLYVCSDLWITVHATALNISAGKAGIKTMFEFEEIKDNSGGDDYDNDVNNSWKPLFTTAADYVDKLLSVGVRKKKAGDLPMYSLKKNGKGVTFHRKR